MPLVEISDDALAFLEFQLRGTLEAVQRVRAQLAGKGGADWGSIPMATVTAPGTNGPADAPTPSLPVPERRRHVKPDVRVLVPEIVAALSGEFAIGAVKKALEARRVTPMEIPDSAIRRTLEEMIARGELEMTTWRTGRGGSKYRKPAAGEG